MRNFPIVLTGNTRTFGKAAEIFPKRHVEKFENKVGDVRVLWFFNGSQAFVRAHIHQSDGRWRNFVIPTYPGGIVPYTKPSRISVTEDVFGLIAAIRGMTANWANSEFSVDLPTNEVTLTGKIWAWAEAAEVLRDIRITPKAEFHPGDVRIQYAYDKPTRKKYIRVSVFNVYWRALAIPGVEDGVVVFKSNSSRNRATGEVLRTIESYKGRTASWIGNGFEIALTAEDLEALEARRTRLEKAAERTRKKNPNVALTGAVWTQGTAAFNFASHELHEDDRPSNGDIIIWVPSLDDKAPRCRYRGGLIRAAIFRNGKRCAFAMRDEAMAEMTFRDEGGRDACIQRAIDVIGRLSGRHATWTKGTYFVPMLNPEKKDATTPTEVDPVEAPPVVQPGEGDSHKSVQAQPELDFNAPLPEGGEVRTETAALIVRVYPTDLFGHRITTPKPKKRARR